jgi:hypothetical protein
MAGLFVQSRKQSGGGMFIEQQKTMGRGIRLSLVRFHMDQLH